MLARHEQLPGLEAPLPRGSVGLPSPALRQRERLAHGHGVFHLPPAAGHRRGAVLARHEQLPGLEAPLPRGSVGLPSPTPRLVSPVVNLRGTISLSLCRSRSAEDRATVLHCHHRLLATSRF